MVSGADGSYQIDLPIDGHPQPTSFTYARGDRFTTYVTTDEPLTGDVIGTNNMMFYVFGDGAMWSTGGMTTVYGSLGATRDVMQGTIVVQVRDCSEAPLAGAMVAFDPAPPSIGYSDHGAPGDPGETQSGIGTALALNAPLGATRITVTAPGYAFVPVEIDVRTGNATMVVNMHGVAQ